MRRIIAILAILATLGCTAAGCGSSHDNLARPTFLYGNPPDLG